MTKPRGKYDPYDAVGGSLPEASAMETVDIHSLRAQKRDMLNEFITNKH